MLCRLRDEFESEFSGEAHVKEDNLASDDMDDEEDLVEEGLAVAEIDDEELEGLESLDEKGSNVRWYKLSSDEKSVAEMVDFVFSNLQGRSTNESIKRQGRTLWSRPARSSPL